MPLYQFKDHTGFTSYVESADHRCAVRDALDELMGWFPRGPLFKIDDECDVKVEITQVLKKGDDVESLGAVYLGHVTLNLHPGADCRYDEAEEGEAENEE